MKPTPQTKDELFDQLTAILCREDAILDPEDAPSLALIITEELTRAPEETEKQRGETLARVLCLRTNSARDDMYETTQGPKTTLGLYRTARGIIEGDIK